MGEQGKLFDVEPVDPREQRTATRKWGGRRSTAARAKCRAMLPWACRKCGGIISPDDPESSWDAGHAEDRAAGGSDLGIEPEHAHCNRSAGGKVGAAIVNARHRPQQVERARVAQWW